MLTIQRRVDLFRREKQLLLFILPLIATSVLQLLFNTADSLVVGRWGGDTPQAREAALAAVGSCGAMLNLFVNLFLGLSVGVSVTVARAVGERDEEKANRILHTSVLVGILTGILVMMVGLFFAHPMLAWMGTEESVMGEAVPYIRAVFIGMPASMVYNYCAAALRATGDTKHPLFFLSAAGALNVILNLILVIVFHLGALGVGIATAFSNWISCILILFFLAKKDKTFCLSLKKMRIHTQELKSILYIGIPSGLTSSLFAISNVLIQSSVNSFGRSVMAGNSAAGNLDSYLYVINNSVYHAALTFIGQDWGARERAGMRRDMFLCVGTVTVLGAVSGLLMQLFCVPLLGLYTDSAAAIDAGVIRLSLMAPTYVFCGLMDTSSGLLRGMGKSILPMITTFLGSCFLRIVWIYTVFSVKHELWVLYLSYPVSWILTASVQCIFAVFIFRKVHFQERAADSSAEITV